MGKAVPKGLFTKGPAACNHPELGTHFYLFHE